MNKRKLREEARLYFLPVLLGSNRHSHALAMSIFNRYGICSYILDRKRSFWDLFDLSARFSMIYGSEQELLCDQLITLASSEAYTLPILIPTNSEYVRAVAEQRSRLETVFVFCEPDRVFSDSPFANFFASKL